MKDHCLKDVGGAHAAKFILRASLFALLCTATAVRADNLVHGGDFSGAKGGFGRLVSTNAGLLKLGQEDLTWNWYGRLEIDRATTNEEGFVTWNAVVAVGGDGTRVGVPVKPGRTYDFSLEVRGSCAVAAVNARAWNGSDEWKDGVNVKCLGKVPIKKDWTLYKGSFKVPDGKTRAALFLQMWESTKYPPRTLRIGDTLDFDNIKIEEAEESFDALKGAGASVEPVKPVKAAALGTELADFLLFGGRPGAKPRALPKAVVTDTGTAFIVDLSVKDPTGLVRGAKDDVWSGDAFELFFGAVADHVDRPFTQIGWNPAGAKFTRISNPVASDGWKIVTNEIKGDVWQCRVEVPHAFLGWRRSVQKGEGIGFNVTLSRKRPGEWITWSPMVVSFHEKEHFGQLYAGSYADAFKFSHPQEQSVPTARADFETRLAELATAAKKAEYARLNDRAFTIASIPIDSDYSVPFVPRAAFHPPTNVVVKGAVNERIGVPVAVLNLTDKVEEYVVRLETDTSDPLKPYAEKQFNGTWGLAGFPAAQLTARVALRMKETDTEPVTLRLDALPKMNEACTVIVPPKEAGIVFFDFNAADVKPGAYRGRLRVIPLGQASQWAYYGGTAYHQRTYSGKMQDVPFTLEILPIVLDREPALPNAFSQVPDSDGMFDLMYEAGTRKFKISPWDFRWARTADGRHFDYSKPDERMLARVRKSVVDTEARMKRRGSRARYYFGNRVFDSFRDINGLGKDFDESLRLWPEYLRGVKRCMNAWGVEDARYEFETFDEPDPAIFDEVLKVHRAAKAAVPEVIVEVGLGARLLTAEQLRALDPVTDAWSLWRGGYFAQPGHLAFVADALAAGKLVTHYTCNTSGRLPIYENYRQHDWFGWRHNLTGNDFYFFQEQTGGFGPADFKVAISAGLVYKSFESTMPSLRYMSKRRGTDDIRYLALLKKRAGDIPEVKKFLAEAPVRVVESESFDTTTAERMRTRAVELLLKYVQLPPDIAANCETWLCAGQSNMQQGWGCYNRTPEEQARVRRELVQLGRVDVRLWNFADGSWTRLDATNALARSAVGVSFAIRRAQAVKKPIAILYVAAGGAPTESFLSKELMASGKYPTLAAMMKDGREIDANPHFPCSWVAREYPRRKATDAEARWWGFGCLYEKGIAPLKGLPLTGILWYQGESNATACTDRPDRALDPGYMRETLRAVVEQLRGDRRIPFLMFGLPRMNRPWEPYRAAQKEVCRETGAIYLDTFAAGLGDENDVHPRNKIPFAEMASKAAAEALAASARVSEPLTLWRSADRLESER